MANNKPKEDENTVTESVTELSTKDKIAKMLADKQANAKKAVEAANKQAKEAEALASVKIDSGVEKTIDDIKKVDDAVTAEKAKMAEELKPLNEQMTVIKAKYNFEEQNKVRKGLYDGLVEKLGETAAKMLTGGAKATGTGSGKGKGGGKSREQAIIAVCDEGLSFEAAATKYDHMGDGERAGTQKIGNLVGRHIGLAVGEGTVIKNTDGTYSRA